MKLTGKGTIKTGDDLFIRIRRGDAAAFVFEPDGQPSLART